MAIDIPIYITYGTKDLGALGCDILPLEFERHSKTNYRVKAYPGLGHNFEEVGPDGTSDYENMYWDDVMAAFVKWCSF